LKQSVYVLINTDVGKAESVSTELLKLDEVKTVNCVTGPYDIIVLLDTEDIRGSVVNQIQKMKGITKTITCLCV